MGESRPPEPIISPDGDQYWDGAGWQLLPPEPRIWTGSRWITDPVEDEGLGESTPHEETILYWITRAPQIFLVGTLGIAMFALVAMLIALFVPSLGRDSVAEPPSTPPVAAATPAPALPSEVRETPASSSPPSAPTPSSSRSPSSPSAPKESFESALRPYMSLEDAEIWFYMLCNEPPVPGNPYEGIHLAGADTEHPDEAAAFEVVMKLLGLGRVTADGWWGADTDKGLWELLATLGMPADQGVDAEVLRRTQELACWDPEGNGLFEYWVDVWPAGLDALESAATPTGREDQPPGSGETARLEQLWSDGSSEFRVAQCRMWRQDPTAFTSDSILAFEVPGDSRLVDQFMRQVC